MYYHMATGNIDTQIERINRLKVVLVKQNRTGKWLAEQLCKKRSHLLPMVLQRIPTLP